MSDPNDLKRAGLKATFPRMRILDVFTETDQRHLTADDVYRILLNKGSDVGMATVYRVLSQLQQAGLVKHARFESGKAIYELDDGRHHDHLICMECGRIQEFHDEAIEACQQRIAQKLGFDLNDHALVLHGHCITTDCPHRHHP